jgi:hypothetical protein
MRLPVRPGRAARCGSDCQASVGGAVGATSVTQAPSGGRAGGGGAGRTAQTVAGRLRYWAAWISASTSSRWPARSALVRR